MTAEELLGVVRVQLTRLRRRPPEAAAEAAAQRSGSTGSWRRS